MSIIKFLFILLLGFSMGFLIDKKYDDKTNKLLSLEEELVLKELVTLSNIKINSVQCELHDNNGLIKKPLISDYIADYLLFSYNKSENHNVYFVCDNNDKCHFSFGLKKWNESYNRILSFSYDKEKKSIDSKSFSCVDVP